MPAADLPELPLSLRRISYPPATSARDRLSSRGATPSKSRPCPICVVSSPYPLGTRAWLTESIPLAHFPQLRADRSPRRISRTPASCAPSRRRTLFLAEGPSV